jgi:hypothetical protein
MAFYGICKEAGDRTRQASLRTRPSCSKFVTANADGAWAHWQERDLAKVGVEGSSPFARSRFSWQ